MARQTRPVGEIVFATQVGSGRRHGFGVSAKNVLGKCEDGTRKLNQMDYLSMTSDFARFAEKVGGKGCKVDGKGRK